MSAGVETTGGLRWHWRALRRRFRWRVTSSLIADWLAATRPRSRHLLLIGGSAGWMMPAAWLQRFERIDVVDLDPLAPLLFRLNHGLSLRRSRTALYFQRVDGIAGLDNLLAAFPQASICFDNVLGQHRFRLADQDQAEAELNDLSRRLQGRDWGSVHDLFSGPVALAAKPAQTVSLLKAEVTTEGLCAAQLCDDPLHRLMLQQAGACGVWMDHLTSGIFPVGTANHLIYWPFSSRYGHWLQAGWVSAR